MLCILWSCAVQVYLTYWLVFIYPKSSSWSTGVLLFSVLWFYMLVVNLAMFWKSMLGLHGICVKQGLAPILHLPAFGKCCFISVTGSGFHSKCSSQLFVAFGVSFQSWEFDKYHWRDVFFWRLFFFYLISSLINVKILTK